MENRFIVHRPHYNNDSSEMTIKAVNHSILYKPLEIFAYPDR